MHEIKIMTISDFTNAVKEKLSESFPECSIENVTVTKNNGVCLTGFAIHQNNGNVAPAIYMEPYYSGLQSGIPFEDIIRKIIQECRAALETAAAGIDADKIQDFAAVKDRICYKLINRQMNKELLTTIPYRCYHDLAIAYYLQLSCTDEGMATVLVTNSMAQRWGMDEAQLFELAHENTPRLNRGCVIPLEMAINGTAHGHVCHAYDQYDFTKASETEMPMYNATNASKLYGASILLYDGLLEGVAGEIGSFLILPINIHETIFVPYKEECANIKDISQMVREINATEVGAQDILADNVYFYDAGKHTLESVS